MRVLVPSDWLLLIHVLPPKPDYLRVKIWRRLQTLGAVAVKNSVYVLPCLDSTREDFQWLLKEIEAIGGEASLCEARFVDGLSDAQIRALFNAARDNDYAQLTEELRQACATSSGDQEQRDAMRRRARRLRKRFDQIGALDFFTADGQAVAKTLLNQLDETLKEMRPSSPAQASSGVLGKTWVTRRQLGVDRMASAWLIQRFIDPAARFEFVAEGDPAKAGELRFDMADADFTHEGDRCTFEVLLHGFGLADPALMAIGQIIHDLDLKDSKFGDEQAAGVAALLSGIAAMHDDDQQRLRSASIMFDALHKGFAVSDGPAA